MVFERTHSHLDKDRRRKFQEVFHALNEYRPIRTIDNAMVKRRREIQNSPNRNLALSHHRPINRFVDAQNADFGMINNRRRGDPAVSSKAGDRKGRIRKLVSAIE